VASPKKNVNKNNPNQKYQVKQNKLISSEHCEKNCKDVGICDKYRNYILRMTVLHKVGKGIMCGK